MDFNSLVGYIFLLECLIVDIGGIKQYYKTCREVDVYALRCNYIPKSVPRGYFIVEIIGFKLSEEHFRLDNTSFDDISWSRITSLTLADDTGGEIECEFMPRCFSKLPGLRELKLHLTSCSLDRGIFQGTPTVHTLDISRCYRLYMGDFIDQLNDENSLPNLKKLYMSQLGAFRSPLRFDLKFVDALLPRNITHLDISLTMTEMLNISAVLQSFPYLTFINISFAHIADIWTSNVRNKDKGHVTLAALDATGASLPSTILRLFPGSIKFANITLTEIRQGIQTDNIESFLSIQVINGSQIIPSTTEIWCKNITFTFERKFDSNVQHLILRKNNIKFFDVHLMCKNTHSSIQTLRHLDISENGLQFIHPSVFACVRNIEVLHLSDNDLVRMVKEHPGLFEEIFTKLSRLKHVSLSGNSLKHLHPELFEKNTNLEIIDLSFNMLEQVHIRLSALQKLRLLDLRNNNIKTLDQATLNKLDSFAQKQETEEQVTVKFISNPFICSDCGTKSFITWLIDTNLGITGKLTCVDEDGKNRTINESTVRYVNGICNRKIRMIAVSVSSVTMAFIITAIVAILYRKKTLTQRRQHRDESINKLREGKGLYEFVLFLSYSSEDDEFVDRNVLHQLNENLQLITGIERNLVCSGDRHLRPGFMVNNETIRCLDRVSLILVVVSNDFCRSDYCMNEFDQSYRQRKPIVLMFKGHVDESLMTPTLKDLYKRDVRILWAEENGKFVLKTTWQNVCTSILERI